MIFIYKRAGGNHASDQVQGGGGGALRHGVDQQSHAGRGVAGVGGGTSVLAKVGTCENMERGLSVIPLGVTPQVEVEKVCMKVVEMGRVIFKCCKIRK